MQSQWQLADAKNKLSEVVQLALNEGPQRIKRCQDAVILLSEKAYLQLTGQRLGFKEFLLEGAGLDSLDLELDKTSMRDIQL